MPESVRDRPTKSHEYIFLLTKQERYHYDADAIREPVAASSLARVAQNGGHPKFEAARERRAEGHISGRDTLRADQLVPVNGRNARSVWTLGPEPYKGAHFAVFPQALATKAMLAGTSPVACGICGAPWKRMIEKGEPELQAWSAKGAAQYDDSIGSMRLTSIEKGSTLKHIVPRNTTGWCPTCEHEDDTGRSLVLDPFMGSGTVGQVSLRHGRDFAGVDASETYLGLAVQRVSDHEPKKVKGRKKAT